MEIYRELRQHLDKMPGGFPETESGVELRILKKLFTPAQAELALHTRLMPETAATIAERAGLDEAEVAGRLREMARQGLLFSVEMKDKPPLYMAAQYVIGIWEYQLNRLDEEFVRDMQAYMPQLFNMENWKRAPQLRTIPIGASVAAGNAVMPYEQAEELIRAQKKIAVAPCICRREHRLVGHHCDKPEEVCLSFGAGAYYYIQNGLGREISQDEALEVLKIADKAGLVLQPGAAKKIDNICCCCGDCCGVLLAMKRHPKPRELAASSFEVVYDADACTMCGLCQDRCQMDVFTMGDAAMELNMDRCIGCGLCVTTCPGEALKLARRPDERITPLPANIFETNINMLKVRGLM